MKTFSRPEISGWKPAPSSISAATRPVAPRRVPVVGSQQAGHQLEQRRLARAVAADQRRTPRRARPSKEIESSARIDSSGRRSRTRRAIDQRALERAEGVARRRSGGRVLPTSRTRTATSPTRLAGAARLLGTIAHTASISVSLQALEQPGADRPRHQPPPPPSRPTPWARATRP